MHDPLTGEPIAALIQLLKRLTSVHHELTEVIHEKVRRMRRADVDALRRSVGEEQELVARIAGLEKERKQLMEKAGRSLGMSVARARAMTVRQLADRLAEPVRGKLFAMAQSLQRTIGELARANRIAGMASGGVLGHLGHVLTVPGQEARQEGYGSVGGESPEEKQRLFEAVG